MSLAAAQLPMMVAQTPSAAAAIPVRAAKLCKSIEARHILRDIYLEIGHGRFIALLGANGAGKSTLLKILSTLNAPSSGKLDLFGIPAA